MRRTSLAAMLTLLAVFAATLAVAGCGGKSTNTSNSTSTSGTTSTTGTAPHKHSTKPAY